MGLTFSYTPNPQRPVSSRFKDYLAHFSAQARKKKNPLSEMFSIFLIFSEMELSSSKIKKVLIFSQKNVFLIFREMKFSRPKIQKFQGGCFQARKKKTF